MAIGRAERFRERRPRVIAIFGDDAETTRSVARVFELMEMAWHDCYAEVTPSEEVVDDVLLCSGGTLGGLVQAAHLAVIDRRDRRFGRPRFAPGGGRLGPVDLRNSSRTGIRCSERGRPDPGFSHVDLPSAFHLGLAESTTKTVAAAVDTVARDASPLLADRTLEKPATRAVLEACRRGELRVVVPSVVVDEVVNAARGSFRNAQKNVRTANDILELHFCSPTPMDEPDVERLTAEFREGFERELMDHGVEIIHPTGVTHQELLDRDLAGAGEQLVDQLVRKVRRLQRIQVSLGIDRRQSRIGGRRLG